MIDGLMAAAAGMEAQQTQLDAVSNDLANLSTPGYQGEELGFHDLLYTSAGPASGTTQATGSGAAAQIVGRSLLTGPLNPTGRPLDIAIKGQAYLEVRRPDGTVGLTRNGALEVNARGEFTTATGMRLVPPVTVAPGTSPDKIGIATDGTVTVVGRRVGRIALATVPAPDQLLAAGDGTFTPTAASGAVRPAAGVPLEQGALEGANVDLASEIGEMINAQRGYQMDSRAIQMQDQMMQIANGLKK